MVVAAVVPAGPASPAEPEGRAERAATEPGISTAGRRSRMTGPTAVEAGTVVPAGAEVMAAAAPEELRSASSGPTVQPRRSPPRPTRWEPAAAAGPLRGTQGPSASA